MCSSWRKRSTMRLNVSEFAGFFPGSVGVKFSCTRTKSLVFVHVFIHCIWILTFKLNQRFTSNQIIYIFHLAKNVLFLGSRIITRTSPRTHEAFIMKRLRHVWHHFMEMRHLVRLKFLWLFWKKVMAQNVIFGILDPDFIFNPKM